jgi:hypothetical protein
MFMHFASWQFELWATRLGYGIASSVLLQQCLRCQTATRQLAMLWQRVSWQCYGNASVGNVMATHQLETLWQRSFSNMATHQLAMLWQHILWQCGNASIANIMATRQFVCYSSA